MEQSLLSIREYFKNNNAGNVKFFASKQEDSSGKALPKEEIRKALSKLGVEGKDFYMGEPFGYKKFSTKKAGIKDIMNTAKNYNTNDLETIMGTYSRKEKVNGKERIPTKFKTLKDKFKKYGLDKDTLDFSNKEDMFAFTKAVIEVENSVKKDGVTPTGWEKYYTDDAIQEAVNEFVAFDSPQTAQQNRPLSSIPGMNLQQLPLPKIDITTN
jgi:hypothetical protein